MDLSSIVFDMVYELIKKIAFDSISLDSIGFFERRKIENRIDKAIVDVVEPLIPFLKHEDISEDKALRLISICKSEFQIISEDSAIFFENNLDGQKLFENFYATNGIPEAIIEDETQGIFSLLFPRIATIICQIPSVLKDWERNAWAENYYRLEEIALLIKSLFIKIDNLTMYESEQDDHVFTLLRRTMAQKIGFELDLTGLRSDQNIFGNFEDFFVNLQMLDIPSTKTTVQKVIEKSNEFFYEFTVNRINSIIYGSAGSGKTTWSKWFQRETLQPGRHSICFRIECKNFSNTPFESITKIIRDTAGQHLSDYLSPERIEHWIRSQKLNIILDGFDEIKPDKRDEAIEWIQCLEIALQNNPIIITSRPLTTKHLDNLGARWHDWQILPFDITRIEEYIGKWYASSPFIKNEIHNFRTSDLAKNWLDDETINPLTGNPLLLTTLLTVHQLDGSLPKGRSQLYRRYVEGMLGIWDNRRHVNASIIELSLEQKRELLKDIAIRFFTQEVEQVDEQCILNWLSDCLGRLNCRYPAPDVLNFLRERTGLIQGPGLYTFPHKTIYEFLVSEAVLQGDMFTDDGNRFDRFCLYKNRNNDRWNTIVFFWAGLAPISDVESFINECINSNNFSLAYGILNDQYERFSQPIRRKLMLQGVVKEFPKKQIGKAYWSLGYPIVIGTHEFFENEGMYCPDLHLREVVTSSKGVSTIKNLIDKCINNSDIGWNDKDIMSNDWFIYMWMWNIFYAKSIGDLELSLLHKFPNIREHILWQLWASQQILFKLTFLDYSLQQLILLYKEKNSTYLSVLPISAISILVYIGENKFEDRIHRYKEIYNFESVKNSIHLVTEFDKIPIEDAWLASTNRWVNETIDSEQIDLLRKAESLLVNWRQNTVFLDVVSEIDELLQYLQKLRKKRATVIKKLPNNYYSL